MKGFLAAAVLFFFFCPAIQKTPAQQTERDRQNFSAIRIEKFDWYAASDVPEPPKIRAYPPDGDPRRANANYPPESSPPTSKSEKFIYRIQIRNLGARTIASIVWNYRFVNPLTGETAALLEFESRARIKPNKRKTLSAESVWLPARTIDVRMFLLDREQLFIESAEVKAVIYAESSNRRKSRANTNQPLN